MRTTLNAQATHNVNARLSNDRVAGIRTQQSHLRQLCEHLFRSWRCFGERALKRGRSVFKAFSYLHPAMSSVQRDADAMPVAVVQRLAWLPVRSVVV